MRDRDAMLLMQGEQKARFAIAEIVDEAVMQAADSCRRD